MAGDFDLNDKDYAADATPMPLPCPLCGTPVTVAYQGSSDWEFACKECDCLATFWIHGGDEPSRALAKWNRRSSLPRRAEETEAVATAKLHAALEYWHTEPAAWQLMYRDCTAKIKGLDNSFPTQEKGQRLVDELNTDRVAGESRYSLRPLYAIPVPAPAPSVSVVDARREAYLSGGDWPYLDALIAAVRAERPAPASAAVVSDSVEETTTINAPSWYNYVEACAWSAGWNECRSRILAAPSSAAGVTDAMVERAARELALMRLPSNGGVLSAQSEEERVQRLVAKYAPEVRQILLAALSGAKEGK